MSNDIRERVALASQVLADNGLDDLVWGHVSLRDPENRGVWMKRKNLGFEEIRPDDVQLIDWNGNVLDGEQEQRHSEWPIHTQIMQTRDDVHSVVHAHPDEVIALGASGASLRPVSHEGCFFWPPEVPRFDAVTSLIIDHGLGDQVAESLGDQRAVLLVNHGMVAVGGDERESVIAAIMLTAAARNQLLTAQFGGNMPQHTSKDEALTKREQIYSDEAVSGAYDYLGRKLKRGNGNGEGGRMSVEVTATTQQ